MNYEFRVEWIDVKVTQRDVNQGIAGTKMVAQIESRLSEMDRGGWEFCNEIPFTAGIYAPSGCLAALTGNNNSRVGDFSGICLVFRKPLR